MIYNVCCSVLIIITTLFTGCSMSIEEKIDDIFNAYNKPVVPGAAVMVIKNGEIVFEKGYGLSNIDSETPVNRFTNFRLASVTKQFTAMSVLLLIERGGLSYLTTLKEVFPAYPDYGSKINIRNLLQHTSGLIDYEDMIDDTVTMQLKDNDVLQLMMQTDGTYFQPGNQFRYSNTGYALLALIVEKVSGKPFRNFLNDNIFNPLGMENTIAYEKNINEVKSRAYGYTITDSGIELTDQIITSAVLGDGGIYSSLNDLYKWDQCLYTEKLIDKKYLIESWTPGVTTDGNEFPYGYGWHLEKRYEADVVYHTGSTRGFRNIIYRIPEKRFALIILTNLNSGPESSTLNFAHKIADIYFSAR